MKNVLVLVMICLCFSCQRFQIGAEEPLLIYKSDVDYRNNIWINIYSNDDDLIGRPRSSEIINPETSHLKIYDEYYAFWFHGCNGCYSCIPVPTSLSWRDSSALDTLTDDELLLLVVDDNPFDEFYVASNNRYKHSCLLDSKKAKKIFKRHKLDEYVSENKCNCFQAHGRECK